MVGPRWPDTSSFAIGIGLLPWAQGHAWSSMRHLGKFRFFQLPPNYHETSVCYHNTSCLRSIDGG